jgi:phosphatidylserine/phosphatidylglycerophosphate/cardiolipin synthase-like enzyme
MLSTLKKRSWISLLFLLICGFVSPIVSADELFQNPDGSPALGLIQGAQQSVDIEIYTMTDPKIHSALIEAMNRGVQVRIIQEPKPAGSSCAIFDQGATEESEACQSAKAFVQEVRSLGGVYVPFNKKLCGGTPGAVCFEHGKMLLADHKTALLSTGNFDPTNLCDISAGTKKCNRDYSFVTSDPQVVTTLATIFEQDLAAVPYDLSSLLKRSGAERLTVSPLSLAPLVSFIDSAQKNLQIDNQYLKQKDINLAIERAAKRGVHVELTVASACAFGRPRASEKRAFQNTYSEFESYGISARMFTRNNRIGGKAGYMHAKVIVVDGVKAWVGSVNGSDAATQRNREFGVFIDEPHTVQTLSDELYRDHHDSASETWQDSINCKELNSSENRVG